MALLIATAGALGVWLPSGGLAAIVGKGAGCLALGIVGLRLLFDRDGGIAKGWIER
jgi:hypothetical protein